MECFRYHLGRYRYKRYLCNPIRLLQVLLTLACLALCLYFLMAKEPIVTSFIIITTTVAAAFAVITVLDSVANTLHNPIFWTSWLMFATAGAALFALCAGLYLTNIEVSIFLVAMVVNLVTCALFLIDVCIILRLLSRMGAVVTPQEIKEEPVKERLIAVRNYQEVEGSQNARRTTTSYGGTFPMGKDAAPLPSPEPLKLTDSQRARDRRCRQMLSRPSIYDQLIHGEGGRYFEDPNGGYYLAKSATPLTPEQLARGEGLPIFRHSDGGFYASKTCSPLSNDQLANGEGIRVPVGSYIDQDSQLVLTPEETAQIGGAIFGKYYVSRPGTKLTNLDIVKGNGVKVYRGRLGDYYISKTGTNLTLEQIDQGGGIRVNEIPAPYYDPNSTKMLSAMEVVQQSPKVYQNTDGAFYLSQTGDPPTKDEIDNDETVFAYPGIDGNYYISKTGVPLTISAIQRGEGLRVDQGPNAYIDPDNGDALTAEQIARCGGIIYKNRDIGFYLSKCKCPLPTDALNRGAGARVYPDSEAYYYVSRTGMPLTSSQISRGQGIRVQQDPAPYYHPKTTAMVTADQVARESGTIYQSPDGCYYWSLTREPPTMDQITNGEAIKAYQGADGNYYVSRNGQPLNHTQIVKGEAVRLGQRPCICATTSKTNSDDLKVSPSTSRTVSVSTRMVPKTNPNKSPRSHSSPCSPELYRENKQRAVKSADSSNMQQSTTGGFYQYPNQQPRVVCHQYVQNACGCGQMHYQSATTVQGNIIATPSPFDASGKSLDTPVPQSQFGLKPIQLPPSSTVCQKQTPCSRDCQCTVPLQRGPETTNYHSKDCQCCSCKSAQRNTSEKEYLIQSQTLQTISECECELVESSSGIKIKYCSSECESKFICQSPPTSPQANTKWCSPYCEKESPTKRKVSISTGQDSLSTSNPQYYQNEKEQSKWRASIGTGQDCVEICNPQYCQNEQMTPSKRKASIGTGQDCVSTCDPRYCPNEGQPAKRRASVGTGHDCPATSSPQYSHQIDDSTSQSSSVQQLPSEESSDAIPLSTSCKRCYLCKDKKCDLHRRMERAEVVQTGSGEAQTSETRMIRASDIQKLNLPGSTDRSPR